MTLQNIKSFYFLQKCGNEYKKIFKEKTSIKILKIIGLIHNIED